MKLLKLMIGSLWKDTKDEPLAVKIAVGFALTFILIMPGIVMLIAILLAVNEECEDRNAIE